MDVAALRRLVGGQSRQCELRTFGGVAGVAVRLRTSLTTGLPVEGPEALHERRLAFAVNVLPDEDAVTLSWVAAGVLKLRVVQCLVAVALVALVLVLSATRPADLLEPAAVCLSVVVFIASTVGVQYRRARALRELRQDMLGTARGRTVVVVRAGARSVIPAVDVLVGDLLLLRRGDVAPADGLVVRSTALGVEEPEGAPVGCERAEPVATVGERVLAGSLVVRGEGAVLVTGVGANTHLAGAELHHRARRWDAALHHRVQSLGDDIGSVALGLLLLGLAAFVGLELVDGLVLHKRALHARQWYNAAALCVAAVAVVVPSGLSTALALVAALNASACRKSGVAWRSLAACEMAGSVTDVCVGMDGTMTQGRPSVAAVVTADSAMLATRAQRVFHCAPCAAAAGASVGFFRGQHREELMDLIAEGIAVNTSVPDAPTTAETCTTEEGVELALLDFVPLLGADVAKVRDAAVGAGGLQGSGGEHPADEEAPPARCVHRLSSDSKMVATLVQPPGVGKSHVHVKGEWEAVLRQCRNVFSGSSQVIALTPEMRHRLCDAAMTMGRSQLRPMALAYADVGGRATVGHVSDVPLTLLAIIGLRDGVRPGVAEMVTQCGAAGVVVRMVTGENPATAISVARDVGIYGAVRTGSAQGEPGLAMDSTTFRELATCEEKMRTVLPRLQVISRATAADQQLLVELLQRHGSVVAGLGQSLGDLAMLRAADVGIAMSSGSAAVESVADVVALGDSMAAIAASLQWSRRMRDDLDALIHFQAIASLSTAAVALLCLVGIGARGTLPLSPAVLLCLSAGAEVCKSIRLLHRAPSGAGLSQLPRGRSEPLISTRAHRSILCHVVVHAMVFAATVFAGDHLHAAQQGSWQHAAYLIQSFFLARSSGASTVRSLIAAGIGSAVAMLLVAIRSTQRHCRPHVWAGGCAPTGLAWHQWLLALLVSLIPAVVEVLLRRTRGASPSLGVPQQPKPKALEAPEAARPRRTVLTMHAAAMRVIAQLKVVAALTAAVYEAKADN